MEALSFGCEDLQKEWFKVFFFFSFIAFLVLVVLWLWIGVDSFGLLWRILVFRSISLFITLLVLFFLLLSFLPVLC